MAQDAVKNVRNAVKGLGQDGKYFASSKKGEVSPSCSSDRVVWDDTPFLASCLEQVSELRAELASPDLDGM